MDIQQSGVGDICAGVIDLSVIAIHVPQLMGVEEGTMMKKLKRTKNEEGGVICYV